MKKRSKLIFHGNLSKLFSITVLSMLFAMPTFADSSIVMPNLYANEVEGVSWQTFIPNVKKEIIIGDDSPLLDGTEISGRIAAITVPADRGTLEFNITSVIENRQVFIPNVLILDENFHPAAFFASGHFKYTQAGIMSPDSVEGKIKLTPALGQKQIYLLIFTSQEDLKGQTTMIASAKAYAAGTGHAVPNIPDPVAKHVNYGRLIVEVKAQNTDNDNVIVGLPLFDREDSGSSVELVSQNKVTTATMAANSSKPILSETANYFDEQIQLAVDQGNINKALQLLEEAEKLGSKTARKVFIKSVERK